MLKLVTLLVLGTLVVNVIGHGRLADPLSRSSIWRVDRNAPINYNDNELFCGGIAALWQTHGGKCGVCGDEYSVPRPQPNENTGIYGRGKIMANYESGSVIDVTVNLTANHKGYFTYHLCALQNRGQPETGEGCFRQLQLADGTTKYRIYPGMVVVRNKIKLPDGLRCEHCVLRWHYMGGNNWGTCADGSDREGCGPQEVFRNCADVRIQ